MTENDQAAEQASDEGPEQRSHGSDVRFRELDCCKVVRPKTIAA
ncbi:hypothetical protein RBSWK_03056 [Rhodopirellula baltica SWK14]|uniref:Uncharacterized protein n=1 Tax=Rhodopirellula baltica SWK14 TaxID=993516 RepID=L7CH79_RHOBT|nr:hypothetical protein RBSWK_03056 [Rhodopirellula baltica SWK14]